jgi:hypothetical protein
MYITKFKIMSIALKSDNNLQCTQSLNLTQIELNNRMLLGKNSCVFC